MKKLTVLASVLFATLASVTLAQAACTKAHMNNRSWSVTAHDAISGKLISCKFRTSGAGSIAGNATGREYSTIGVNTDFSTPTALAIFEGSISGVPGDSCAYNATLKLGNGSSVLNARVVLESGKTIANGNFLLSTVAGEVVTPAGGGTISMMRQ